MLLVKMMVTAPRIDATPRVAMNELTFSTTTMKPFTMPTRKPTPIDTIDSPRAIRTISP